MDHKALHVNIISACGLRELSDEHNHENVVFIY